MDDLRARLAGGPDLADRPTLPERPLFQRLADLEQLGSPPRDSSSPTRGAADHADVHPSLYSGPPARMYAAGSTSPRCLLGLSEIAAADGPDEGCVAGPYEGGVSSSPLRSTPSLLDSRASASSGAERKRRTVRRDSAPRPRRERLRHWPSCAGPARYPTLQERVIPPKVSFQVAGRCGTAPRPCGGGPFREHRHP